MRTLVVVALFACFALAFATFAEKDRTNFSCVSDCGKYFACKARANLSKKATECKQPADCECTKFGKTLLKVIREHVKPSRNATEPAKPRKVLPKVKTPKVPRNKTRSVKPRKERKAPKEKASKKKQPKEEKKQQPESDETPIRVGLPKEILAKIQKIVADRKRNETKPAFDCDAFCSKLKIKTEVCLERCKSRFNPKPLPKPTRVPKPTPPVAESDAELFAKLLKQIKSMKKNKKQPKEQPESDTGDAGQTAANYAKQQVGKCYSQDVNLRRGPKCFDCSGLVNKAWEVAGKKVPWTTHGYPSDKSVVKVSSNQLRPGDICYRNGHVAMYIGGGQTVEAANPSVGVVKRQFNASQWTAFYRPK
jgi:cell wall-associated NlpC family hydrolase